MNVWCRRLAWVLLLTGCARSPGPPGGTGAREAAQGYYTALVEGDWPRAYAALHPDAQARWSSEQFARLGQRYRLELGIEQVTVRVRSCEEHGADAIAHVVLTGRGTAGSRRYKDGAVLRHSASGWGVVPPRTFGLSR
jgi:hypothetical protein